MRLSISSAIATGLLLASLPCVASARPRHVAGSAHASIRRSAVKSHKSVRVAVHHDAPAAMDVERATEIQSALIKSGYLSGEPSGRWDSDSVTAMQKLQGDHGWQTKITPDSRALITLGLGPQQVASSQGTN